MIVRGVMLAFAQQIVQVTPQSGGGGADPVGAVHPSISTFGSFSPLSCRSVQIDQLVSNNFADFVFNIAATGLGQGFIRRLIIESAAGIRVLEGSAASFTESAPESQWLWGTGSARVWTTAGDAGVLRKVAVIF